MQDRDTLNILNQKSAIMRAHHWLYGFCINGLPGFAAITLQTESRRESAALPMALKSETVIDRSLEPVMSSNPAIRLIIAKRLFNN